MCRRGPNGLSKLHVLLGGTDQVSKKEEEKARIVEEGIMDST
jgi:hypothetical protein